MSANLQYNLMALALFTRNGQRQAAIGFRGWQRLQHLALYIYVCMCVFIFGQRWL